MRRLPRTLGRATPLMSLISILIPTRNRATLARLAAEAALVAADGDCEIVLADNSDQPVAIDSRDPRLRYLPPPPAVLSMPDNWERALAAARGEWVMLLADKYMLVQGEIGRLRELTEKRRKVVTYAHGVLRQGLSEQDEAEPAILSSRGGLLQWPAEPTHTEIVDARVSLEAFAPLVSRGSYIVVTDGIMQDLADAPASRPGVKTILRRLPVTFSRVIRTSSSTIQARSSTRVASSRRRHVGRCLICAVFPGEREGVLRATAARPRRAHPVSGKSR